MNMSAPACGMKVRWIRRGLVTVVLAALLLLGLGGSVAEQSGISGELVIYSSMYPFVLDMLDEALCSEFPELTPGNNGSFFVYGGSSALITLIHQEMKTGQLGCDMMMVAEPALSLELKDAGYLEPVQIENPNDLLRFPYDEDGCWYPVRVCNMVLAYNPQMESEWAAKGVTIPRTFKDFASDRSLKGFVSMGDPLFSGTTFAAVASLMQANHYGRQYLMDLAANDVKIESGSAALEKVQSGEYAATMILEESVLKALSDAEKNGTPLTSLRCIYPEDGVILIPSTIMTVADDYSKNANADACKAVEKWFLSEETQGLIMKGFMHSVFKSMKDFPEGSVDTDWLIQHDLGVKWSGVYRGREDINLAWSSTVLNKNSSRRRR